MEADACNLNSNDAFVLVTSSSSMLWAGHGSCDVEKGGAKQLSEILGVELAEVAEGDEGGV